MLSSSVHRIFQARGVEWVAISDSRGSCQPRDGEGSVFFFFFKEGLVNEIKWKKTWTGSHGRHQMLEIAKSTSGSWLPVSHNNKGQS